MADPNLMALARRLKALEHNVRQTKQPNLGFSTMDGGAIQATNGVDETLTLVMGEQFDGTNTAASITGPTPPTPTQAMTISAPGALRIYWDGTFEGDALSPMDWARVTVHVVPAAEYDPGTFTPLDQTQIYGSFETARGGEVSPVLEPGDYVAVLVSWSQSGKFSPPAEPALGTVSLIVPETGPDGNPPSSAPTIAWTGGIGSVFYRWNQVANADPTEYALYVRAGSVPTTTDDTYLVAAGNISQAVVREALGPDPDNLGGPEIDIPVVPGVDFYGVVVAYDADGQGPDSMPAIAQSVEINSPDIAADAITTRHLQADSVGVDQIQAGAVDADRLAARLILASEMLLGTLDNNGLDPAAMNPNLLPPMTTDKIVPVGTTAEGTWNETGTVAGWSRVVEQFSPPNDDAYWQRMATGTLNAIRFDRTVALSGPPTLISLRTKVTVEPLTEYRFEMNSSMPGMDPNMPLAAGNIHALNSVKLLASSDDAYQTPEVISWKTFVKDDTPRPDLTKADQGVIRTGDSQTTLYLKMEINAHHMLASAGGFLVVFPELRKMESTTVAGADPVAPSLVSATDVSPSPTSTTWQMSAVWGGATSGIVRTPLVYTASASGGSFSPSKFSLPGRYATPGQTQSFQQARGVRISTQSGGSGLTLRARIVAPVQLVPALGPMETLFVNIGLGGLTQATDGVDDATITASWYDATNALISDQVVLDLDAAGVAARGITNLTENYWSIPLVPPVGAAKVVFWTEYSNGPSGNIAASTNHTPGMHGLRLHTLDTINYNYGSMAARRVEIDSSGIRMVNAQGQVQISIPTDENATPMFRGGIEADFLRVFGGASLEGQSEIAKDAVVTLSNGIKSPVGAPTLTQEYEQYTLQRQPPDGEHPGFSTKPTLNPSQITGMVWKSTWGELWVAENRGGGASIWRYRTDGTCRWASLQAGWSNVQPLDDPRSGGNLIAGEYGGNHWAVVYNGSAPVVNRIPDGVVPDGVEPVYTWNSSNNRLYVWYPHTDGSGRNVYKRLSVNNTSSGSMALEETVVGGTGTSRASHNIGLAGAVAIGTALYTVARDTMSSDVFAFASGAGGALNPAARWPLASSPRGFTYNGQQFWQVDAAGKFTRYSDWTWAQLDHKLFAGITWFDSDTGGTGLHETDLTKLASITLKKRISGVRVTLPAVPDKGGSDDPDRWRLYAFKGSALALPGGRTSMFLQSQGGSAAGTTAYIIPANGLITSGTNPPAANNFPGAGAGKIVSSATDGSSDPLIQLKGSGEWRLGNLSGDANGRLINRIAKYWDSSTVGIPSATDTGLNFSTKVTDTGYADPTAFGSFGSNRFNWSGPSGLYRFTAYGLFAAGTAGTRRIMGLYKNATTGEAARFGRNDAIAKATGGTATSGVQVTGTAYMTPGDYIQVTTYQDSGGALDMTWRWFEIERIN